MLSNPADMIGISHQGRTLLFCRLRNECGNGVDPGQALTKLVMQFSGQKTTLFLLKINQLYGQFLTFGKQLLLTCRQLIDCFGSTLPLNQLERRQAASKIAFFHALQSGDYDSCRSQGTADAQKYQQTNGQNGHGGQSQQTANIVPCLGYFHLGVGRNRQ
jgi:hypothetical protein